MQLLEKDTTELIIKCFYNVYNELGFGFLEKVYENALFLELTNSGLYCVKQKPVKVYYQEVIVGNYYADIIVNDSVIIELKAAESLVEEHELQLINYLKATDIEVGMLLNFGRKPQFSRKVFSNKNKKKILEHQHNRRHPCAMNILINLNGK